MYYVNSLTFDIILLLVTKSKQFTIFITESLHLLFFILKEWQHKVHEILYRI